MCLCVKVLNIACTFNVDLRISMFKCTSNNYSTKLVRNSMGFSSTSTSFLLAQKSVFIEAIEILHAFTISSHWNHCNSKHFGLVWFCRRAHRLQLEREWEYLRLDKSFNWKTKWCCTQYRTLLHCTAVNFFHNFFGSILLYQNGAIALSFAYFVFIFLSPFSVSSFKFKDEKKI